MKLITVLIFTYASSALCLFGNNSNSSNQNLLETEKRVIQTYKDVKSSVVNITNITKYSPRRFFRFQNMPDEEFEQQSGAGTGFVWDSNGHIITNYHVVAGKNSKFMISFNGSKEKLEAKIVGVEPKFDIAVLKVKKLPFGAKAIIPGTSHDLQVGQIAMAIGNPFELDYSLTKGIISALGRKIKGVGGVDIHNMIQTDATINPGNSGGPLINSSGKLIGMNTMIYSKSGASDGIGFAVPVDDINMLVPDLIKYGKIKRAGLGVQLLSDRYARSLRSWGITNEKEGLIIADVPKGTSASKAGLQGIKRDNEGRIFIGDIILKIEGLKIKNYNDIFHALRRFKVNDKVNVTLRRSSGKKKTIKIRLQELSE